MEAQSESVPLAAIVVLIAMLAIAGCSPGEDPEASALEALELVGVDFELNSLVIENTGNEVVRTEGLWAYRDGDMFQFNIFLVEPRATILFSMRELGEISTTSGELALADSETFEDPEALLDYVAWGQGELELSDTATEAGLWPPDEEGVEMPADTIILVRIDPGGSGPLAWEPSSVID